MVDLTDIKNKIEQHIRRHIDENNISFRNGPKFSIGGPIVLDRCFVPVEWVDVADKARLFIQESTKDIGQITESYFINLRGRLCFAAKTVVFSTDITFIVYVDLFLTKEQHGKGE